MDHKPACSLAVFRGIAAGLLLGLACNPSFAQDSLRNIGTTPSTYLLAESGLASTASMDMAVSPYVYRGTGTFYQLGYERFNGRYHHTVQLNLVSSTLEADVPGIYPLTQDYYALQYTMARKVMAFKRTDWYVGGTLNARMSIRETPTDKTGEGLGSLEVTVGADARIAPWYRLTGHINLPLVNALLFRGYGLGEEDFRVGSWGSIQGCSARILNSFRLGARWNGLVGYSLTYYSYSYGDEVSTLLQQYSLGLSLSLGHSSTTR